MECDSIHSNIEKKSKNIPVYIPEGWTQVIRTARKNPSPFVEKQCFMMTFIILNLWQKKQTRRKFHGEISAGYSIARAIL